MPPLNNHIIKRKKLLLGVFLFETIRGFISL